MKTAAEYRERYKAVVKLLRHAWVHSAYPDCGFMHMTTDQKKLYCKVIGDKEGFEARLESHIKNRRRP